MDENPLWRALASGELVHIAGTLEVRTRQILEQPPARPLALDELTPGPPASQAHAANMPSTE
jgi:glutamine amidotransferase